MANVLPVYNKGKVAIAFLGQNLSLGLSADTFLTVTDTSDRVSMSVGADGGIAKSVMTDKSATAELVLQQNSQTNIMLSAVCAYEDENDELIQGTMTVFDPSGGAIEALRSCHIQRRADTTFGADSEAGDKTWTFGVGERKSLTVGEVENISDLDATILNAAGSAADTITNSA